ncbi:MAG: tetratricopeptide repeat protein [Candidatus Cloacimonetes bacterium]|nr:tetratricopeptide repeat protein [Candidatus Cloacimonadota bacterium]
MKQRGTLVCSLAVWCLYLLAGLSPVQLAASSEEPAAPDFISARRDFLARRLHDFNSEQILLEKQLVWELHSIYHALTLPGARSVYPASQITHILSKELQSPLVLPDSTQSPVTRLDTWVTIQQTDLVQRLMLADEIRTRLLAGLGPDELNRQFRQDLGEAVVSYARGDYELAARLLHTIRMAYPYTNVDDLLFFEGEAYFAENLFDKAGDLYRQLLRQYPGSEFRLDALRHLLYIETYFGHFQRAQTEYTEFRDTAADGDPEISYIMGIVAFQLNNVPRAQEVLGRIPRDSSYYYRAQHLQGVCWILESEYDKAIAIFESLLELPLSTVGLGDVAYMHEDARIKLGHLYFEKGDFEGAASMFSSIDLGSEWYDDALIGQAWSDLNLADYENAAQRARSLAEHLPESEYLYEARTLAGYANEKLENSEESAADYSVVLDHAERSEELRTLMAEQGEIQTQIRRMAQLEEDVFVTGNSANWQEYLDLRASLRQTFRRIKYTELAAANKEMKDYLDERKLILDIRDQLGTFDGPMDSWDGSTTNSYMELRERVQQLMGQIRVAGLVQIRRNPVVLKENESQMAKAMVDSLMFSSKVELEQLDQRQNELRESRTMTGTASVTQLERAVLTERFANLGERLDRWRVSTESRRDAPFSSDLPHWSNLAFSRLVLGDIRFDELEKLDERIRELEGYLERIDSLLKGDSAPAPGGTGTSVSADQEQGLLPAGAHGEARE